ncbi:hypothetical protein B0T17DRAFT_506504 [Bombardia bombarda]|uniref:Uncharacterized protein n=1 Tax=Bombardia bombarda TaxID=252184 RepID=A0AA39X9V2_9PEZI|nr:hypothetical protein B0T17DRAFT_506504 [Bombardia bombarda]
MLSDDDGCPSRACCLPLGDGRLKVEATHDLTNATLDRPPLGNLFEPAGNRPAALKEVPPAKPVLRQRESARLTDEKPPPLPLAEEVTRADVPVLPMLQSRVSRIWANYSCASPEEILAWPIWVLRIFSRACTRVRTRLASEKPGLRGARMHTPPPWSSLFPESVRTHPDYGGVSTSKQNCGRCGAPQ